MQNRQKALGLWQGLGGYKFVKKYSAVKFHMSGSVPRTPVRHGRSQGRGQVAARPGHLQGAGPGDRPWRTGVRGTLPDI